MTDYLNNSNRTTLLFKKFQNKIQAGIDTGTGGTTFFNESKNSLNNIYNTDIFIENIERNLPDEYKLSSLDACGNIPGSIWKTTISDQDYSDSSFCIPDTNLIFYKEIYLSPVSGTNNAWWFIPEGLEPLTDNNLLKDMIPFNFNPIILGTFLPIVKYWDKNKNKWISEDQNIKEGLNWLIDYSSGILQFYQDDSVLNDDRNIIYDSHLEYNRPRISFIKYVGKKGLENLSSTDTNTTYSAGFGLSLDGTTFSIGQPVEITSNVQFNNLTVNGTLRSDDITGSNVNVSNDLIVSGNLTVNGTQTIINSTIVDISDNKIVVNAVGSQNTAGIIANVNGVEEELIYDSKNSSWNCNSLILNSLKVNGKAVASLSRGLIVMWSETMGPIPPGWVECDGTNGTPDLRDKFIVGAGSDYHIDTSGGQATVKLKVSHLPSHYHSIDSDVVYTGEHIHEVTGYSNSGGVHNHETVDGNDRYSYEQASADDYTHSDSDRRERLICVTNGDNKNMQTLAGTYWDEYIFHQLHTDDHGGHTHYVDFNSQPNGSHGHEIKTDTKPTGEGGSHENIPPYYALFYIMKT